MKREALLNAMIRLYGFEHEAVIEFARLMENPQISDEVLATIVLVHEECPLEED